MLKLQKFLKSHPTNWRELLQEKPYSLRIRESESNPFVMFSYNMIDSKFDEEIVCESRGIILEKDTWEVVCHPFHKFFNYGEPKAAHINWKSAICEAKIDGSLIKIFCYKDVWFIATNNSIDAYKCGLPMYDLFVQKEPKIPKTFGELFDRILSIKEIDRETFFLFLDKGYTHMFEICSIYNRVVVLHENPELYYLSSKDNNSNDEIFYEYMNAFGIHSPDIYPLQSLEECINASEKLGKNEEGFVVVDDNLNRVKIKSPLYISLHHLKDSNNAFNSKYIVEIIQRGEDKEVLSYFPEYGDIFDHWKKRYDALLVHFQECKEFLDHSASFESRKELALWAKEECENPSFVFCYVDKKVSTGEEFVRNMRTEDLMNLLKRIEVED